MTTHSKSGRPLRTLCAGALATAVLLTTAACSAFPADSAAEHSSAASSSSAGFPVTITHAYGKTVIRSKPHRIATVGWGSFDNVIALGVVPVSIEKSTYGKTVDGGYLPWTKAALDRMGVAKADLPQLHDESDGIDVEAIAASRPDLIIGLQSGMTKEQYATLSAIAPTIAYQKVAWGDPWRSMVATTAKALGEVQRGARLIRTLERRLHDEAAQYPKVSGTSAAVMYFDSSTLSRFSIYTTTDVRPQFLNDLGFTTPASIRRLSSGTTSFYADVSSENADEYNDVDVIVTYGTPGLLDAMRKDPLLSKIPAVRRGSVVVIDSTSELANALDPSALSIPATTAQYMKLLGQAAARAK
ncbi:MAG: iron-siderophore ABC transporter substrate-binding protein [Bifidobacterium sp.]|jgi:iron complex transport system substrate-binding protein|nr:iron-siderophore ABC transporter substrate-binding protein [Bifidobacterium sp.]MCI1864854.1 iron-siderophore ABC transporter substrate-binding protein [Bifidobacterium sp.]